MEAASVLKYGGGSVLSDITIMKALVDISRLVYNATHFESHEDSRPLINCELAPYYGQLGGYLKDMDHELKVMMGVTIKELNKLQDRSWENLVACMANNAAVEPLGKPISNYKSMDSSSAKWFTYGLKEADKNSIAVREAETWIEDLISDKDVIKALSFEPLTYAKFVNRTGTAIDNYLQVFFKNDRRYKSVIDVGVLRYPDPEHPYFKLFRVEIKAYSECTHTTLGHTNVNGMMGEYHCYNFAPRRAVIAELSGETKQKAVDTIEALFN